MINQQIRPFFRAHELPWVVLHRENSNFCVAPKICNQDHGRASRRKTQPSWGAHKIEQHHGLSAQESMGMNHPHWAKISSSSPFHVDSLKIFFSSINSLFKI